MNSSRNRCANLTQKCASLRILNGTLFPAQSICSFGRIVASTEAGLGPRTTASSLIAESVPVEVMGARIAASPAKPHVSVALLSSVSAGESGSGLHRCVDVALELRCKVGRARGERANRCVIVVQRRARIVVLQVEPTLLLEQICQPEPVDPRRLR